MEIETPLHDKTISRLKAGDNIKLSGTIYTARDAAHSRLVDLIKEGKELPFSLNGQVIYYVGPAPSPPGKVIGSAGPTTSYRMDTFTPLMLKNGLKGMIGKGKRSERVKKAISEYKGIYLAAVGGAGALIAKTIKNVEIVAYPELGTEAVRKLEVESLPLVVVNDIYGNDLYEMVRKKG
ncbi:MAG: Fe-S-containing hydro-lyase [Halanaerobiaceae bacterium]